MASHFIKLDDHFVNTSLITSIEVYEGGCLVRFDKENSLRFEQAEANALVAFLDAGGSSKS